MRNRFNTEFGQCLFLILLFIVVPLICAVGIVAWPSIQEWRKPPIVSPDGQYSAKVINQQYRVKDETTGEVIFTTHPKFDTPNDVKNGGFNEQSTEFVALYHYESFTAYTWYGVWNLESGEKVREFEEGGWKTDIKFFPDEE